MMVTREWRCSAALLGALLVSGCASDFYLAESEVAVLAANFRTAAAANEMLDNLNGQVLRVDFAPAGSAPRISGTNLTAVLRDLPQLFVIEQLFRQIRLDRIARQIEEQADVWLADRLNFFLRRDGARVTLQRIERATVYMVAPPKIAYDVVAQTIGLDVTIRLSVNGLIKVRDPGGIFGPLIGLFLPDGDYPLTLVVDGFRLRLALRLAGGMAGAAWVRLDVTPSPGRVRVLGTAPGDVKRGIRRVVAQELAVAVTEQRRLQYDHFALSGTLARGPDGIELRTRYRPRPTPAEPLLDVVARTDQGRLMHARRRADAWRDFKPVPMSAVGSDPALVASGPDRLELVAISSDGELLYTAFRNGGWGRPIGSWSAPRGGWQLDLQKPALVATAPGQLDIVAVARGGALRHLRRINGGWRAEQSVDYRPARPPLRDPLLLQVGNQLLLLYVDSRNGLYGNVFDLEAESWGETFRVPSQVSFTPAAAACGDGQVDLVYVVAGGSVRHRRLEVDPLVVGGLATLSPERIVGGGLLGSPSLVCSGYRRLELLGPGPGNRLWHNSFRNETFFHDGRQLRAGWQGWHDASRSFFGTVQSGRVAAPVAIVATRTGQVHAVARSRGSRPTSIYHNGYDAARYGIAPWKAVGWRGLQRVARARFIGRPALAIADRGLEIVTVGADGRIWQGSVSDGDVGHLQRLRGAIPRFPADPVVLSSGPGLVDVLYLRNDSRPAHVRRYNRSYDLNHSIPTPSSVGTVASIAAVSFGRGQIELVGQGSDRALYHWRFRRGRWSSPTRIGGSPISLPVLLATGAGQLELFAVGPDQRLWRWRFLGGRWLAAERVGGGFPISAALFGPSAATSWGDGTSDLVVAEDGTGRLFHARFSAGAPPAARWTPGPRRRLPPVIRRLPPFRLIGGEAAGIPVVIAQGPRRIRLLVSFSDGRLYSAETRRDLFVPAGGPGLPWHDFVRVGRGRLLGGAVRLGDREMAAIATDADGRIRFGRAPDGRWMNFSPLAGQDRAARHRPPYRSTLVRH